MKANRTHSIMVIAWFVALPLAAEPSGPTISSHMEKANQLVGMTVTDSRHQPVGKLCDLVIDLQAGRVAEMIIDTAGRLTPSQRTIAVPPEFFAVADSGAELRMTADIDNFENAPAFVFSRGNDAGAMASMEGVYKRFHLQPYAGAGRLEMASRLTGHMAMNQRDQHLGTIDTMVVELPGGRIPDIIFASRGFLGRKGVLTAIPPEAFLLEPDRALILDATKDALKSAPHFKAEEWRDGINTPITASAVYDTFQVLHSITANEANEVSDDSPVIHTVNGPESQSDATISLKIEEKIQADQQLSLDARRVQVITHKGRVTLRGLAETAKEKQRLSSIAATVVPSDHIDNEVVVKALAFMLNTGH